MALMVGAGDLHSQACTSASTASTARRSWPSAARAAIRASVTSRGSRRPTSVRCRVDWCHTCQASAVRALSTATSTGPAGMTSSRSRTASRMAGTASCGMRANDVTARTPDQ